MAASDCELQNRTDAEILTDIQARESTVTAFSWNGTVPKITYDPMPGDTAKATVAKYFNDGDHKKWVDVTP